MKFCKHQHTPLPNSIQFRNCLGAPILGQKIGIFADVDVGTHGRASLREKNLAKTGAKGHFLTKTVGT